MPRPKSPSHAGGESRPEAPDHGPRLHVYLAQCGVASRRACEELIASGRVSVNGKIVRAQGTSVPVGAKVLFDGHAVHPVVKMYLALNKPPGYVCSNRKVDARPIATELFRGEVTGRLFHVGRLDALSSGLILYTNDGELAQSVTHPSRQVEKEYLVDTADPVPERVVRAWSRGVIVDGVRYVVRGVTQHSPTRLALTLMEGKNREIRRILEAYSIRIRKVHRIRVGAISIRGLRPGEYRRLTPQEIRSLAAQAPAKPGPARGRPRRGPSVHRKAQ